MKQKNQLSTCQRSHRHQVRLLGPNTAAETLPLATADPHVARGRLCHLLCVDFVDKWHWHVSSCERSRDICCSLGVNRQRMHVTNQCLERRDGLLMVSFYQPCCLISQVFWFCSTFEHCIMDQWCEIVQSRVHWLPAIRHGNGHSHFLMRYYEILISKITCLWNPTPCSY